MLSEPSMTTVGLVLHPTKPVSSSVDMIVASARNRPVRVLAREIDRDRVPVEVGVVPDARFLAEVDGLVALGGDGTMLGAMRLVIDRPVPAEDRVSLTAATDSARILVEVDGTSAGELGHGDRLTAAIRPDAAQIVRLSAKDHASRSRVKLSLLDLPLRRDQLLELIPPELRRDVDTATGRSRAADPASVD